MRSHRALRPYAASLTPACWLPCVPRLMTTVLVQSLTRVSVPALPTPEAGRLARTR